MVADPSIPDRLVSSKSANRPFLAHKEYRERRQAEHDAWAKRMKERDEKIARGEKVGPAEKDPTAEEEVGLLGLLKFLLYLTIFAALAGKFFTGSYTWDYKMRLKSLEQFLPTDQTLYSEGALAQFDGAQKAPIYIAIDGDVYDVTSNKKAYGPGGSYHLMAGVDAARAYGTGCFKDHRTHDLRGLTESELRGVEHWKKFFAEHPTYKKVGRVNHPPIDPASPIPAPCLPAKTDETEAPPVVRPVNKKEHDEL
jgi:predicted heme/steroid binding protein